MLLNLIVITSLTFFLTNLTGFRFKKLNMKKIISLIMIVLIIYLYIIRRYIGYIGDTLYGGNDSIVYMNRFLNSSRNIFVSLKNQGNEFGYGLLVFTIRFFTSNYTIFQIVYYLIILYLVLSILSDLPKNNKWYMYILVMIFITLPIMTTINLMRNYLAYFITFYAYTCLIKGKRVKSIVLFIISVSIHIASIAFIIVYFIKEHKQINRRKLYTRNIFMVLSLTIILLISIYAIKPILLNTKYYMYLDFGSLNIAYGIFLERLTYLAIIFLLGDGFINNKKHNSKLITLMFLSFIPIFLQTLIPTLYRMNYFFDIISFYIIINIYEYLNSKSSNVNKNLMNIIMISLLIFKIYSYLTKTIPGYGLLPWKFL